MSHDFLSPWQPFTENLRKSDLYRSLAERASAVGAFGLEITRLPLPAAAWTLGSLAEDLGRPLLVVVPNEVNAYGWIEAARLFRPQVSAVYFPAPPLSPYQEADISLQVRAAEAIAVDRLANSAVDVLVTTPQALFRRLPKANLFRHSVCTLSPDDDFPLDELIDHLLSWGYHRADLVVEVGQFAVRGGVFDLFTPGHGVPVRLDLFGDTIESIREVDPESQRSGDTLETLRILPLSLFPRGMEEAREVADLLADIAGPTAGVEVAEHIARLRDEGGFPGWEHYLPLIAGETVSLPDLLSNPLVVSLDQRTLLEEATHHADRLDSEHDVRSRQRRVALPPEELEHPRENVLDIIDRAHLRIGDLFASPREAIDFSGTTTDIFHEQLERFPREVETARSRDEQAVLVAPQEHLEKLGELLRDREITVGPSGIELIGGDLQRGFRLPAAKLMLFTERQLLRRSPLARRAKPKKSILRSFLGSLRDLKIGDYVVHSEHGIGQFTGLRTLGGEGRETQLPPTLRDAAPQKTAMAEVMEIAYKSGQRLLVPLDRLDLVQKYSGIEGLAPKLDKLGGTSWKKTKTRVKKGLRDMADQLIKLYAERQVAEAPQMSEQTDLVQKFETAFEYDETIDQLDAIEAIREDLKRKRPMDRLLCGDVGFGKTEVAMRAALTAADNGYQVAVLAPTTILADQHLETFRERFSGLPINIEMISRFRTAVEAKEIQKKVEAGKVDILIGTHRLLQKKIIFKKLGLLIIDEEQRFGVAHKEQLKQLRNDVHVLAMSATPVPRTLQLSLAGVRDLSLIETPPRDRMAVETAIVPFDGEFIREAVEYELARGGQVYYVYNRVESIEGMASWLREVIPGLKVTVGHGQLDEKELSKRMHAFVAGEHQLLLATTIIENGIDIPNVNTMIIHRADRFGLSQLYQLRGRVGRSDQLGFCYLLVEEDRVLSADAKKRLDAIREFTELGAGFRVAGRDLEIRGAGNLLGAEQSGHISALGIETYLKLLQEAVAELKGEEPEDAPSVTLDLPVPMAIPEDYVGDPQLRLEIYRRLASAEEDRDELLGELRDRFGPPPEGVLRLLEAASVKRLAEELRLQSIAVRGGRLVMQLRQDARVDPNRLIRMVSSRPGSRFSPAGALSIEGVAAGDALDKAREILEILGAPEEGA